MVGGAGRIQTPAKMRLFPKAGGQGEALGPSELEGPHLLTTLEVPTLKQCWWTVQEEASNTVTLPPLRAHHSLGRASSAFSAGSRCPEEEISGRDVRGSQAPPGKEATRLPLGADWLPRTRHQAGAPGPLESHSSRAGNSRRG